MQNEVFETHVSNQTPRKKKIKLAVRIATQEMIENVCVNLENRLNEIKRENGARKEHLY